MEGRYLRPGNESVAMEKIEYHLVQANVAIMLASFDNPRMADFVNQVDDIDALAQVSHWL